MLQVGQWCKGTAVLAEMCKAGAGLARVDGYKLSMLSFCVSRSSRWYEDRDWDKYAFGRETQSNWVNYKDMFSNRVRIREGYTVVDVQAGRCDRSETLKSNSTGRWAATVSCERRPWYRVTTACHLWWQLFHPRARRDDQVGLSTKVPTLGKGRKLGVESAVDARS